MFADDVVILANSQEQLQQFLVRLAAYCKCWGMTVNIDKTKVMIFDRNGFGKLHRDSVYVYDRQRLEMVNTYKNGFKKLSRKRQKGMSYVKQ